MAKKKIAHKGGNHINVNVNVKNNLHSKQKVNIGHKKRSNKTIMISAIIAVLVIAAGAYYFLRDPVMATVNGEPVYKSEVKDQFDGLSTQYGAQITMDIALNQTIIEKLLMQEARKSGIVVTDESLEQYIDESLAKSGQTRSSFEETLKAQNMTFEKIKERIRVQLAITELVNKTFSNIQVSDKEVRDFYDQNKQLFEGQNYSVVKDQIAEYLKSQEQVRQFQAYVLDLREKADVQIK